MPFLLSPPSPFPSPHTHAHHHPFLSPFLFVRSTVTWLTTFTSFITSICEWVSVCPANARCRRWTAWPTSVRTHALHARLLPTFSQSLSLSHDDALTCERLPSSDAASRRNKALAMFRKSCWQMHDADLISLSRRALLALTHNFPFSSSPFFCSFFRTQLPRILSFREEQSDAKCETNSPASTATKSSDCKSACMRVHEVPCKAQHPTTSTHCATENC